MTQEITISDLKRMMSQQRIHIIDIRDNYQFQLGNIPTSRNVPMNFLLTVPENYLNKEDTYYLCCEFGSRSKRACQELLEMGYHVVNIAGGYQEYCQTFN